MNESVEPLGRRLLIRKADLKGQYPKHYWPDDPLQAQPTNRTKKRMGQTQDPR